MVEVTKACLFVSATPEVGSFMDAFNDDEVPNEPGSSENRNGRLSIEEDSCIICLQRIQDRYGSPASFRSDSHDDF